MYSHSAAQNIILDSLWENRIFLMCNVSADQGSPTLETLNIFSEWRDYQDRDIVFIHIDAQTADRFHFSPNATAADLLHRELGAQEVASVSNLMECDPVLYSAALIGKDGTLKAKWTKQPPTSRELFSIIDAMPMRRREMQEQRKGE